MKITVRLALIVTLLLTYLYFPVQVWAKTFYLDGNLSADCSGSTYSVANRNCSGSDGQGHKTLQSAIKNLVGSDTLFIRAGTYIRTTNHTFTGSLPVSVSGTPAAHTIVRAYPGEQPVICTETGRCQYNPNPGDTSVRVCTGAGGQGGAACYYPNPAISISGNYIDVIGLKTFGQVLIHTATNVTLQDSDIGGGGPHTNQGAVVMIAVSSNLTIRNNLIHHAAWGESSENGSTLMGYDFSATIENNEFYDGWSNDVWLKDAGGQAGRATIVRNNFFRRSTIQASGGTGFQGLSQDVTVDNVHIHNNIFLQKNVGILWHGSATKASIAYNNTFVNCGTDIFDWIGNQSINLFNNLHYHSTSSQKYYDLQVTQPFSLMASDYNNFFSLSTTNWHNLNGNRGSTLSAWRTYSGKDTNSISTNPNFVNATGTRPEHFKRTSYPNEISGSQYGTITGAYETGNEVIGISQKFSPPNPSPPPSATPPPAPTGLTLH